MRIEGIWLRRTGDRTAQNNAMIQAVMGNLRLIPASDTEAGDL